MIMSRNFVLAPVRRVDHERQEWLGGESVANVLRHAANLIATLGTCNTDRHNRTTRMTDPAPLALDLDGGAIAGSGASALLGVSLVIRLSFTSRTNKPPGALLGERICLLSPEPGCVAWVAEP
jgi:hypothetical protein